MPSLPSILISLLLDLFSEMEGDDSTFNLLKHFHTVFYKVESNLSSHQHCIKVLFSPCPHNFMLPLVSPLIIILFICLFLGWLFSIQAFMCSYTWHVEIREQPLETSSLPSSCRPGIEPQSWGLAAGASLLSRQSLVFHLFDDGRH